MVGYPLSWTFMLRIPRCEKRKNPMEHDLDSAQCRRRVVLYVLVDAGDSLELHLYIIHYYGLHLYAHGRSVYEPTAEEQHDG